MKKTSCPGKGKRKYLDIFKKWLRPYIPCVLLSLGVGLCISPSLAQTLLNDIPLSKLETEIKTLMENWSIPGMSICIICNGEISWHRGLGVKNAQTGEPVNDQTIFQAASTSKPVFAYAVLKMCDEGLIDLDKPLVNYVPQEYIEKTFLGHSMDLAGFKKEWFSKITARMCLSHRSGLQHFGLKNPVEILFEPGTKFWYSSNGIEYLRYIVEKLKGSRIDTLIAQYVFKPLGMTYSSYVWRDEYQSNAAPGHDKYGQTTGSMDKYTFPTAQASLYTNAQDYGKFLLAVMKGEGLKKETHNEMLRPQIQSNPGIFWGLGFGLEMSPGGRGIWHWGDGGTHTSYFYGNLEKQSGFVYFVNSFYGLAILEDVFTLVSQGEHPALSFSIGAWSFHDDYLSPAMRFQNKYFTGQTDEALGFYRQIAGKHERGKRFIDEILFQSWATDLLIKNKISEAVTLLQMLIEAYYAEQSETCRALAMKYYKTKANDAAAEYLEAIKSVIRFIHFHWTDTQFSWILDKAVAALRPVIIEENVLLSYVGSYPPLEIRFENGHLIFNSRKVKFEMIPLGQDTFMLKDVDYLRIQIIGENSSIIAIKGIWSNGQTKIYQKAR